MGLCEECIGKMVKKLTPNDIYLLIQLKDKRTAQTGESREDMLRYLKEIMSSFQMKQSLMRLDLLGFVGKQQQGKTFYYHITNEGLMVLNILSAE